MSSFRQIGNTSNSSYHLLSTYYVPKITPNLFVILHFHPNNCITHKLILPEKQAVAWLAPDHIVVKWQNWDLNPGVYDSRVALLS